MKVTRASSGSTWERTFGYARAARAGDDDPRTTRERPSWDEEAD